MVFWNKQKGIIIINREWFWMILVILDTLKSPISKISTIYIFKKNLKGFEEFYLKIAWNMLWDILREQLYYVEEIVEHRKTSEKSIEFMISKYDQWSMNHKNVQKSSRGSNCFSINPKEMVQNGSNLNVQLTVYSQLVELRVTVHVIE